MSRLFYILFLVACLPALPAQAQTPPAGQITDAAQQVYEKYGEAIYQIQVIDLASGKKASIGSGFQFTKDGMIATNYHVVAGAIRHPQENKLEYLHETLGRHALEVVAADVVNDLAILKTDKHTDTFVALGSSEKPKGTRLFSFGNPHDIGFTIVEGTNNGRAKESFVDKLHFSGALNPGMSGGPALTRNGEVIGVNVSTAGNQIGFLVPVEHLKTLFKQAQDRTDGDDFLARADAEINAQLMAAQDRNIKTLLEQDWDTTAFGPFMMPGRIHEALKCWGNPLHEQIDLYQQYYVGCETQDHIYLDDRFDTGVIRYWHSHLRAKDSLNTQRFYSLYEDQFSTPLGEKNSREDDVTNFDCHSRFVELAGHKWKASFCARRYRKYPELYDIQLFLALLGQTREGMISFVSLEGVSEANALAFTTKFMESFAASPAPTPVGIPEDKQGDGM